MKMMIKLLASPKWIKRLIVVVLILFPPILLQTNFMLMFVPSGSMSPCLDAGDFLIGTRSPKHFERGDLLVFKAHDGQMMIKRLVGMPGEKVALLETGEVLINGQPLEEFYVLNRAPGSTRTFQIPDGKLLFLGDNRGVSLDARYWDDPYIAITSVMAKANYKIIPEIKKLEENKK